MSEKLRCPKCGSGLMTVTIRKRPEYGGEILHEAQITGQIEVDQCLTCHGIWFDAEELDHYLSEKLFLLRSPKTSDYRKLDAQQADCPKCKKPMRKDILPKWRTVIADLCDHCGGIWLDCTEIEKLSNSAITFSEKLKLILLGLRNSFRRKKPGEDF